MPGFIYRWTNTVNNKKYIGSHMGTEDDGYIGSGKLFLAAVKKYGINKFEREILEWVDTTDRFVLLEREKYYLNLYNAASDKNYYNVAKDVIGGNTKEGWSPERREKYRNQIRKIWNSRSEDTIRQITSKRKETIAQNPEAYREKIVAAQKSIPSEERSARAKRANYPTEKRKQAGRLGKQRMGIEKVKEVARKNAQNMDPETKKLAKIKARITAESRTEERKAEVFKNRSNGRKGKCKGDANGRARTLQVDNVVYTTIKSAIAALGISEGTLYKRLRSEKWPSWKFIDQ